MPINVLPRPKTVHELAGRFRFDRPSLIALGPNGDDDERFAATVLADAVEQLGGFPVAVERHGKLDGLPPCPVVRMLLLGRDEGLCPDLARLAGEPGRRGQAGRLTERLGREGYALEVAPKGALVAANSSAGLFYAAQTLAQMLEKRGLEKRGQPPFSAKQGTVRPALPACRIVDWPDFAYRGFMLDVSRFRVPTTDTLADLVARLAGCKINCLQLYVEHTFRCRRHPGYSEGCSPLTAEQLASLDQLCRTLHVELQANQNSLGHLQHLLSQPRFAHLAERTADMTPLPGPRGNPFPQPWSFRLDDERVYELLDDIYAEHLPAVRSPLAHLGCDEVWDLGTGRSKRRVARVGPVRAFVEHVKRIAALARAYGKQAMIWDDMVRSHPEALDLLPNDIIPVFWWYEREPNAEYRRQWAGRGRRHWIAPGCCGWQTIFAQHEKATKNLRWMTVAGRAGGAEGVLNTEWGDGGNFQTLAACYWSIALGAELSWNVDASETSPSPAGGGPGRGQVNDFDARFARAFFADRSGRMGRLYSLLGRTNSAFRALGYQGVPFVLYWADFPHASNWSSLTRLPQPGPAEVARCRRLAERALALAAQVRREPPPGADDAIMQELISAAEQTVLACRKADLAFRVRAALKQDAGTAGRADAGTRKSSRAGPSSAPVLPAKLKREIATLAADWLRQKAEFRRVWLLRNETGQIDYRLKLYDERYNDFARLLSRRVEPARRKKGPAPFF